MPSVEYNSAGQLLVIGPSAVGARLGRAARRTLEPSVLMTRSEGGELPAERRYPVWSGRARARQRLPRRVRGRMGAGQRRSTSICARAAMPASTPVPKNAIDFTYQIDPARCKAHRKCVTACGAVGAIDFSRVERARARDASTWCSIFRPTPLLRMPDLPQGYAAPGADPLEQALAAARLAQLVGEFEKPRFFDYKARICAHSRSGQDRLQPLPRGLLDRGDPHGRRSRQGRAAPVRRLRRLRDGVSFGRDDAIVVSGRRAPAGCA